MDSRNSIISGMSVLINPSTVRKDINVLDVERAISMGDMIEEEDEDTSIQDSYNSDLSKLADNVGLSLSEFIGDSTPKSIFETSFNQSPSFVLGKDLVETTREQQRHEIIDRALPSHSDPISFEQESREDEKYEMLAAIDELYTVLKNDNIDLSRIPILTKEASYEDVEGILRILQHKNDHNRYCALSEELCMFGVYTLEDIFNGQREWFGHKPDLTGWHNHVRPKLKRMKHDSGQIVANAMQSYNFGPTARLFMELIPNMVLYSKMKNQNKAEYVKKNDFNELNNNFTKL